MNNSQINKDIITATASDNAVKQSATDIFPWWSFSKTCLSASALLLVARGKLELDSRVGNDSFTLRQLLRHTAGLPDYGALPEYNEAVERGDIPWTEDELLEKVKKLNRNKPGTRWSYSNIGYLYVRRLIEQASDQDLNSALSQLLFRPLDIPNAHIAESPADVFQMLGSKTNYHPGWVYHGLITGPLSSATLFLHRLMRSDTLPKDLLRQMMEPYPLDLPIQGRPWRRANYGLGLMIDTASPKGRCYGHTGQGPGSTCAVYYFPDCDTAQTAGVFVLTEDQGYAERCLLDSVT